MSTLKVNTLQNTDGVEVYTCKAWVNFNGTGTVAIRGSGNVAGITDNNPGDYTITFTNAMPDANYAANVSSSSINNGVYGKFSNIVGVTGRNTAPTTTALRVFSAYTSNTFDEDYISVSIFR